MHHIDKYNHKHLLKILVVLFVFLSNATMAQKIRPDFDHHYIANPLPGNSWGTGAFTLADFDKDGDMDITIDRRTAGTVFWYEYISPYVWVKHEMGPSDGRQLGAKSADLNGDGYEDLLMGRIWFKNPGNLDEDPDQEWPRYEFNGGLETENHDIGAADISGDGSLDAICYSQDANNGTLRWYSTTEGADWTYHDIATDVNATVSDRDEKGVHAGFAPNGIGDLNGDGAPDIVMPEGWYKNPGNGEGEWELMEWAFEVGTYPNAYGTSMRSWILDIDQDGDHDIVYADCDNANSQVYVVKNEGGNFKRQKLEAPGEKTGSYHSLVVADFNNDGKQDIFAGEQEHVSKMMKPEGMDERGLLYINTSRGDQTSFTLHVIHEDNPGWHDTRAGDVDGDGDIDLVTKIWNKDGANYHASFWENKLIDPSSR